MSALTVQLDAALSAPAALVFHALEIQLPGHNVRLLDGAGVATFSSMTFSGSDATYGTLAAIDTLSDGIEEQAPRLRITLLPPTTTAAADLASMDVQGSLVRLWFGAINPVTGLVVPDPDLWFAGALDVPTLSISEAGRTLEYEVASVWDRFFRHDEGARLNDAFHQSVWPGELGFEFVNEVQRQLPWGADTPRPGFVRDVYTSARGRGGSGSNSSENGQAF